MKDKRKRIVAIAIMLILVSVSVFASGDDFGFNEYFGKVKTFLTAIGGALLIISGLLFAIKIFVFKNFTPEDKKAVILMLIGGILFVTIPTIVSSLFSTLGGVNI